MRYAYPNDPGGVIREDTRHQRQVAGLILHCPRGFDDGALALGLAIEIAHEGSSPEGIGLIKFWE